MQINQAPHTVPHSATSHAHHSSFANRMQHSKALVAIVAVLGVTVMALTAALVVNRSDAQPSLAASTSAPIVNSVPVPSTKLVSEAPKAAQPVIKRSPTPPVAVQPSQASFCAACGTVEAVTAVQRQGQVDGVAVGNQTIGLGTVAGGLIGGLLGNQVGGGNGKTLATVAGVAGGAFAGNTIEKNMKQVTVYDVRLRMDDGSRRNMEVSSTVSVGSKVIVEGKNLRMANTAG